MKLRAVRSVHSNSVLSQSAKFAVLLNVAKPLRRFQHYGFGSRGRLKSADLQQGGPAPRLRISKICYLVFEIPNVRTLRPHLEPDAGFDMRSVRAGPLERSECVTLPLTRLALRKLSNPCIAHVS